VDDDALWRELFCRRFKFEVPLDASPPTDVGGWRGVYRYHEDALKRILRGDEGDDGGGFGFGRRDAFARGMRGVGAGRSGAVHVYHGGTLVRT
jgi:hypothetical protein